MFTKNVKRKQIFKGIFIRRRSRDQNSPIKINDAIKFTGQEKA